MKYRSFREYVEAMNNQISDVEQEILNNPNLLMPPMTKPNTNPKRIRDTIAAIIQKKRSNPNASLRAVAKAVPMSKELEQ